MSRTPNIVKEPSGRPARTPVGRRNILSVRGKEEGYEYRIVNDTVDRVDMFKEAGWEVVSRSDVSVGDKRVAGVSATGTAAEVSVGGGQKGVVMRIKKEWFDEDQERKRADIYESEASFTNGADYGDVKIERGR